MQNFTQKISGDNEEQHFEWTDEYENFVRRELCSSISCSRCPLDEYDSCIDFTKDNPRKAIQIVSDYFQLHYCELRPEVESHE